MLLSYSATRNVLAISMSAFWPFILPHLSHPLRIKWIFFSVAECCYAELYTALCLDHRCLNQIIVVVRAILEFCGEEILVLTCLWIRDAQPHFPSWGELAFFSFISAFSGSLSYTNSKSQIIWLSNILLSKTIFKWQALSWYNSHFDYSRDFIEEYILILKQWSRKKSGHQWFCVLFVLFF